MPLHRSTHTPRDRDGVSHENLKPSNLHCNTWKRKLQIKDNANSDSSEGQTTLMMNN